MCRQLSMEGKFIPRPIVLEEAECFGVRQEQEGLTLTTLILLPRAHKGSTCPVHYLCTWPAGWSLFSLMCDQVSRGREQIPSEHNQVLTFGCPGFSVNDVLLPISDHLTYKNGNFIWLKRHIKVCHKTRLCIPLPKIRQHFLNIIKQNPI